MTVIINGYKIKQNENLVGEWRIDIPLECVKSHTKIEVDLLDSNTYFNLAFCVDALKKMNPTIFLELFIPYFPYSRDDVKKNGTPFYLKTITMLINALKVDKVTIVDPHSRITRKLLKKCHVIEQHDLILKNEDLLNIVQSEDVTLVAPDYGESLKLLKLKKILTQKRCKKKCIYGIKERDLVTNKVISISLKVDQMKTKNYLILDDISDSGDTVYKTAKVLKENGAEKVFLFVTHGIFSKGMDFLKEYIDDIFFYQTFNT
ncbi:MAG: ribose-phosphate pyrophosphokinase [Proteobacteria bacterium]|nr:ribose-phosphate pyrophosphokinase [Pseudomonadota bacterium]